jgi:LPXTG-site transpeptidase (sortase) family protein
MKGLRLLRQTSLWCGALLGLFYVIAAADGQLGRHSAVVRLLDQTRSPDQTLWSAARIHAFVASRSTEADLPVALLRIPSLLLVVPLFATSSVLHLNRGAGLIDSMASPGEGGNLGIAAHRDGFFRPLKDIAPGALIEVQTPRQLYRYRVVSTQIVDAADSRPLADTSEPTVTLVTCYPFYYLGNAPRRFIVRGAYVWPGTTN